MTLLAQFMPDTPGDEDGWFLPAYAGGWLLIPLLTAIFAEETHW